MESIPLLDLKAQYQTIGAEVDSAIRAVVESCAFIKGPAVKQFESAFAEAHGLNAAHAIGCSNGTSALTVALKALDLAAGTEVILPAHTFFATVESVLLANLKPVFVDIKPTDYTIDPKCIEQAITSNTSAIIPVHIYGTPANMKEICALADAHGLSVVEDTAQAHLARLDDKTVGSFGDAGTYSFYPGKNLGAYGDAGLVLAKSREIAQRIRKLIDHGRQDKYLHEMVGDNLRIDSIQAAILDVKLQHLETWNAARRAIADKYDKTLQPAGFKVIEPLSGAVPVYHIYLAEVSNRNEVMAQLKSDGISTGIHYPTPLHQQPAMQNVDFVSHDLSVTESCAARIVSLPIFPELSIDQQERIMAKFLEVAKP